MKVQAGRLFSWAHLTISSRRVRVLIGVAVTMVALGAGDLARAEPVNITQGNMLSGWGGWNLPAIYGTRNVLQLINNTGQNMTIYTVQGYPGDPSISDEQCMALGQNIYEAFNIPNPPGQVWNRPGTSGEMACVWKTSAQTYFQTIQFDSSLGLTVPAGDSFWAWFAQKSDGTAHWVSVYAQPTAQVSQVWRIPVWDFSGPCSGSWNYSPGNQLSNTSGHTRHVSGFNVYASTHFNNSSEVESVSWGWVGVYDALGNLLAGGPSSGNAINQGYVSFSADVPNGGYIAAQAGNNCTGNPPGDPNAGWDWAVYVNIGP